ncbi:hypothetical protein [Lachnoclostridium sp. Marseille-P6806]|uniref:hypothetical protein n=1 Tax=Lachnoclostridium sp. Marseille-P6806 TaxID=2364793 RepID=UPI00102FA333|nr:hypothetical protein [Lachnoclostridium sp. Marseille-P6806]
MGFLSLFNKDNDDAPVKNPGDSLTFFRTEKRGLPGISHYDAVNDTKTTSILYKNKEVTTISKPRDKK